MGEATAERIFTVDEAAEFARVTPQTIRRWFGEGLRHFRTANNDKMRGPRGEIVRLTALLAFIEAHEVGAASDAASAPTAGPGKPAGKRKAAARPSDPFNLMGPGKAR